MNRELVCPSRSAAASCPNRPPALRRTADRRPRPAIRVSSSTPLTSRSMLSAICPRRPRVAGDLDHGCDRIARRRAESGREHDNLRAAADHAGDRLDVEPRRVHHRQALAGDRRGIAGTTSSSGVRSPPLCVAPERLLFDRRQAAADVARRRLRAADVEAERHARRSRRASMTWMSRAARAGFGARAASRCSAPMISAISPSTAAPPRSTSRSATRPSAGFDASPEV